MEKEKYVDESWKESATEDKQKLESGKENAVPSAEGASEAQADQPGTAQQSTEEHQHEEACGCGADHDAKANDFEINFINYVSSLGFQALIFLGDIPNPVTNETDKNLDQAKFLIDTLVMLREKTKGNLNQQEENLLNSTVYELQMKFVDTQKKETESD